MSALHVVVRPRPNGTPPSALAALTGLIDVVVDGVNLTARVGEGPALDFLVDLSLGLASVLNSPRARTTVPLHTDSDVWELGLEISGESVLLSVFQQTPQLVVAAFERTLRIAELRDALQLAVLTALSSTPGIAPSVALGLKAALRELETLGAQPKGKERQRTEASVAVQRRGFRLAASGLFRTSDLGRKPSPSLERADLHGVLLLGRLELRHGEAELVLKDAQIFLDVERLLSAAQEAALSLSAGRPTFRRIQLSTGRLSLRRGPGDGPVELRIDANSGRAFSAVLPTEVLTRGIAELTLKLAHTLCERDVEQASNLRVQRAVNGANELLTQLSASTADESMTNPQPDSYRRFVPRVRRASGLWEHGAKMRFLPRWVATVPRIDLKATFLCGDRFIVGGASETACLDRRSGEILWRKEWTAAASVVTPSGLVRVEADGRLRCHHLDNGEDRFDLRIKPRSHGGATGSVLYGPGLPKLLALREGDRQVTGIDLVSGEVRWRYTAKRAAPYRVRRAGRLLIVGGGDPLLVALDGVSGDVVWSLRSRLPFSGDLALDHDTACTLSGSAGGSWQLHKLNPWSGEECWKVELPDRPLGRAPLLTPKSIVVPTCDGDAKGAIAFDRQSGQKLWEQAPGLLNGVSAWLAVDDCVLVNCARGIFMGLDANSGAVRFNHVFSSTCEADQPRRLEPVLRCGALFVPQERVHVLRPLSGELLGALPSDLVPDLIRVDERCDVYVAEESGHLAAFGAAPKLAVVR